MALPAGQKWSKLSSFHLRLPAEVFFINFFLPGQFIIRSKLNKHSIQQLRLSDVVYSVA